jgi:hypothetical protein
VGDAVGPDRLGAIRLVTEDVGVGPEQHAVGERGLDLLDPVRAQQLQRLGTDGGPPLV